MNENEFRFVAPRAKLGLAEWHSLKRMVHREGGLFDKNVFQVVNLITVPVRPQNNQSQNAPVGSINTIYDEERRVNSGGGDVLHANYSQRHKAIKVQDHKRKPVSHPVVTVFSLPPELHLLIFAFVRDYADVVSFGITNQYFLSLAREVLDDYFMSSFGEWAGMNIVCVCREMEPNDYPPGLFSAKELEVLRQRTYTRVSGPAKPFTLSHFALGDVSSMQDIRPDSMEAKARELRHECLLRGMESDPGYRFILPQLRPDRDTYLPPDEKWILRNLTTKQIVRSDAIALSPEFINGPTIDGFGFMEILISKVCWGKPLSYDMEDGVGIKLSRGIWAGHRFDITTLSRHEEETRGEEWGDSSDEIVRETVSIWEGELGTCFRDFRRECVSYGRKAQAKWPRRLSGPDCGCHLCIDGAESRRVG